MQASIFFQNDSGQTLIINELRSEAGEATRTIMIPGLVDVSVNGQPGVWIHGGKNALVWEENGITYSVNSLSLSLDETLKVAESLGK